MQSFVFNSFKNRLMKGEVSGEDTWRLQPVNSKFVEDYEDILNYVRNYTDLIYLNPNYKTLGYDNIVQNFNNLYLPDIYPVNYQYTTMKDVDIATEPQFVTEDNYLNFVEANPNENDGHLSEKFFNPDGEFYKSDTTKQEIVDGVTTTVPVARGFYYVKTKEELKWCADKVNGANYNNKINIVLGDNIGKENTPIDIDFSIGENPEHPFEGVFYGNGFKFIDIRLICRNNVNGIIGYLGTEGKISTVRLDGKFNEIVCKKKLGINHLSTEGTDIVAGFFCGKNNGSIRLIDIKYAKITISEFIPGIYSVSNKRDDVTDYDYDDTSNIFYPDYLCYNSLGNIVPYIGYFNEGVFATMAGYDKKRAEAYSYWRTFGPNAPEYDGFRIKNLSDAQRYNTAMTSPAEWYYFDGVHYTNDDNTVAGYIDSYNTTADKKDILFYDTNIFCSVNEKCIGHFSPAASSACVLPIDFKKDQYNTSYGGVLIDIRKSRYTLNQYRLFEETPYLDTPLKMAEQNRVAYYVSLVAGVNNGDINSIVANEVDVVTSGTFVGFIGGIAGKQLNGNISTIYLNMRSMDVVDSATSAASYDDFVNGNIVYHKRNYYTSTAQNGAPYYFPLQSIKNIGGMFGECVLVGNYPGQLNINDVHVRLENQNSKIIVKPNGNQSVTEDYYIFDKYATIAPIIEYNTSNLGDVWYNKDDLNNESKKLIYIRNSDFVYNESLTEEDKNTQVGFTEKGLFFRQIFNTFGNTQTQIWYPSIDNWDLDTSVIKSYQTYDGAASPLFCEIKPVYQTSPSVIETPYINNPYINYSAINAQFTENGPYYTYYESVNGLHKLNTFISDAYISRFSNTFDKTDDRCIHEHTVGLYAMDQNLASPVSDPEFYSINLDVDLPGVANTTGMVFNRFTKETKNVSLDIRNLMKNLIYWDNVGVHNNHNVWTYPDPEFARYLQPDIFKYTTVPMNAQLPLTFKVTDGNTEREVSSIDEMNIGDKITWSDYNGNKIPYTYSYFGSDLTISRNTVLQKHNDLLTNLKGYTLTLKNPSYGTVMMQEGSNAGGGSIKDDISGYKVNVTFKPTRTYKVQAILGNGTIQELAYTTLDGNDVKFNDTSLFLNSYVSPEYLKAYPNGDTTEYRLNNISGYSYSHTAMSDPGTFESKIRFTATTYLMLNDGQTSPYMNMQWNHLLIGERSRGGDGDNFFYAVSYALQPVAVEPIYYPAAGEGYVTGYKLNMNDQVAEVLTATTPPPLYSAYMTQKKSTYTASPEQGFYPADENGVVVNDWSEAALTGVSTAMTVLTKSENGIYTPEQVYGDGKKPDAIYEIANEGESAIWSAAICQLFDYNGNSIGTALMTRTLNGFAYESQTANYNLGNYALNDENSIFYYGDEFEYLSAGEEYQPITPADPWYTHSQTGAYTVNFANCTWDNNLTANHNINILEAQDEFYKPSFFEGVYPIDNYRIANGDLAEGEEDKYDFYRYTYLKEVVKKTNIGKEGINLPVKYDVINNKAGFWFNMHEEPIVNNIGKLEKSAYNDDIKYTSNILYIGKTPNQRCILSTNLSRTGVSAVTFSGFSADDFQGLYVMDSKYNPVMYIDVGLGECSEGTTWTYSSYPSYPGGTYSSVDGKRIFVRDDGIIFDNEAEFELQEACETVASGLLLEVET